MAAEGLLVQVAVRVLEVSQSGYYEWRGRPPSQRAVRHAWLTDLIRQAHDTYRGTYGIMRVHAELVRGQGIADGHGQVELLMRRAGSQGVTGRPKWRHSKQRVRGTLRCRKGRLVSWHSDHVWRGMSLAQGPKPSPLPGGVTSQRIRGVDGWL
jgi:HTH-like domain